ncbi:hypothetical protein BU16DRAFT_64435 [Lophium mytilinum]|uniref:Uncharacterized protein n=1 Tax=Lophium mytilinum TaxID=390894 RepID=A0A6A6QPN2_9PEZI|nr:hypothetical protein BU16DRAFT_64435 [Lophium mytilinum]
MPYPTATIRPRKFSQTGTPTQFPVNTPPLVSQRRLVVSAPHATGSSQALQCNRASFLCRYSATIHAKRGQTHLTDTTETPSATISPPSWHLSRPPPTLAPPSCVTLSCTLHTCINHAISKIKKLTPLHRVGHPSTRITITPSALTTNPTAPATIPPAPHPHCLTVLPSFDPINPALPLPGRPSSTRPA